MIHYCTEFPNTHAVMYLLSNSATFSALWTVHLHTSVQNNHKSKWRMWGKYWMQPSDLFSANCMLWEGGKKGGLRHVIIWKWKQRWVHYHTAKQNMIREFHSTDSPLSSVETWETHYNDKTMHKCVQSYSGQTRFHFQCASSSSGFTENTKRHKPCMLTLLLVWKSEHLGHDYCCRVHSRKAVLQQSHQITPPQHLPQASWCCI